jgi:hypothetical protein
MDGHRPPANGRGPRSFAEYVDSLPWVRGELNASSYLTFLRAASLGVASEEAISMVARRIKEAGDHPRAAKLRSQFQCAAAYVGKHGRADFQPVAKKSLDLDKMAVRRVVRRCQQEITPAWLRARSPVQVMAAGPELFLHLCYQLGERVVILTDPRSDGKLWENFMLQPNWNELGHLRHGHQGVWFMIQPVDGQWHFNPRQGHESRRSEESVTSWRYAILESDEVPASDWLKILVQLPVPIQAIYSSGGDSVHALVRVNARSKEHWDQIMRRTLLPRLAPLGVDPGALTAVRLSRLPGCHRGETGRNQELYYLNPRPEALPLL